MNFPLGCFSASAGLGDSFVSIFPHLALLVRKAVGLVVRIEVARSLTVKLYRSRMRNPPSSGSRKGGCDVVDQVGSGVLCFSVRGSRQEMRIRKSTSLMTAYIMQFIIPNSVSRIPSEKSSWNEQRKIRKCRARSPGFEENCRLRPQLKEGAQVNISHMHYVLDKDIYILYRRHIGVSKMLAFHVTSK